MTFDHLLITFIAITALAVITQGVAAAVMAVAVLEIKKRVIDLVDTTKAHIHPLLKSTNGLLDDVSPRLNKIGDNLVEVSETVKTQAAHINATLDDILLRTHRQVVRADDITTHTFAAVESTRSRVENIVDAPLRIASGIANGVLVGVETLFRGGKRRPAERTYSAGSPEETTIHFVTEVPDVENDLYE